MKRSLFFICCFLSTLRVLHAQCPEKVLLETKLQVSQSGPAAALSPALLQEMVQYESALDRCSRGTDTLLVRLRQAIGKLYYRQGRFNEAITYIRKSNRLISDKHVTERGDPTALVINYLLLASCYEGLNMRVEKMDFFDSCLTTYNGFGSRQNLDQYIRFALSALRRKTEALYNIGDYKVCYETATTGERLNQRYHADKDDSLRYSITFLTHKANSLLTMREYAKAEALLLNQLQNYRRYRSYESVATIYDLLGRIQIGQENTARAKEFFMQSIETDRQCKRWITCMETYINLGYLVYDKAYHDTRVAMRCYRQALACFHQQPNPVAADSMEVLNLLANMAHLFVQERNYDSAFYYFQAGLNQLRPGLQDADLLALPLGNISKVEYLTGLLLDRADAYFQLYKERKQVADFQKAIQAYRLNDEVLDKLRTEQSDIQSKLFWRKDNHRLYEHAIEACYLAGGQNDVAFYFFEKSRAVLLNDQLTEQMFLDDKDIYRQAFLVRKLVDLQKGLSLAEVDSRRYDSLENERMRCKQQLEALQKLNKARNGHAYRRLFDSSVVTIANVQKKIMKDHDALVELFTGDDAVYEMVITRSGNRLTRISRTAYDTELARFLELISNPGKLNRSTDSFVHTASRLYSLLFRDQPIPGGRIIISPDGQYFPVEALVSNEKGKPFYFVMDHAVSYTYSARYLLITRNRVQSAREGVKTLLGMAPVNYPYDATLSTLQASAGSIRHVRDLIGNSDELLFGEASRSNFRNNFYKYKINYLSTHASDSGSQGEPVIYFSDGPMALSELVAETRPATELVIASACKTGVGNMYRGEGVYNFSRGFAAVGIPACVNNLWSVDAASANELTELFCLYVEQGNPTDVALQKAKKAFMQTAKDARILPYYWGASILSGSTGVIDCQPSFLGRAVWITAGAGLLALLVVLVWWKRKEGRAPSKLSNP